MSEPHVRVAVVCEDDAHFEMVQILVDRDMTTAIALDVPLVVDIGVGDNWLACKS